MCRKAGIPLKDEPTQTATIAPERVLALAADVEQAGAEGERDRQPDEDQRRRLDERLLERERRRSSRSAPPTQGNSQLSPVPLKIAL